MKPKITLKETFNNVSSLSKAMRELTDQDVYIGIPEDENARKEAGHKGISNAYLGYIHEFGVPEKNIPARPHLIPGITDIRKEAGDILEATAKAILDGQANVSQGLNKIGLLGQNAVRARFVKNDWPPLKDGTLDRKALLKDDDGNVLKDKKGNKKRKKSRRERERLNPLIDTSQLRRAHTYVIRKRGNQGIVVNNE